MQPKRGCGLVAAFGSGFRIPLYYGGSFAYLASVVAVVTAPWGGTEVAQVGVVATGVLNILVGIVIRYLGKERLDKILPPAVTGSVAIVIGIALSKEALDMATSQWGIALVTMMLTILFSVYLRGRGLLGMLPVLLGAVIGYLVEPSRGMLTSLRSRRPRGSGSRTSSFRRSRRTEPGARSRPSHRSRSRRSPRARPTSIR
jgi:uracil permease